MDARSVDVLLIGGGVASARCARTLRRRGFGGSVLLVGEEATLPYNRPPLSKELLRGEVDRELILAEQSGWWPRHGIEVVSRVPVVELDVADRQVVLADGSRIRYGHCLLATGAAPRRPAVPGADLPLILRTVADAEAIRRAAKGRTGPAVVIGGGFIGVEVGASLARLGVAVTLLELSSALWAGSLGEILSRWARDKLAAVGVTVRLEAGVTGIDQDGISVGADRLPAALAVAGVGVQPRTELAEAAGVRVADGVVVDGQRSAAPGLFAAGDVARVPHPLTGGTGIRVEHWHAAREGGEAAALAMLGQRLVPPRAPWVYTEFADQLLDVVGWAPEIEDEVVIGDLQGGRFAVAHLVGGRVAQLAVANSYLPIDEARRFVEASPSPSELRKLVVAWPGRTSHPTPAWGHPFHPRPHAEGKGGSRD